MAMKRIYPHPVTHETGWPRVRELPEAEREAFTRELRGQTRPLVAGVKDADQDFFYPWDYLDWKDRQIGIPTTWD